jgi:hypothetical protein
MASGSRGAPSTAARTLVLALLASHLAACESDERAVGPGREQPVVHAVLDPGRFEQSILLERTLTGRVAFDEEARVDPLDPIVSGGGTPISGARVVVYAPGGDSVVAVEEITRRTDGRGAGVYRVLNHSPFPDDPPGPYLPLEPGGRYALRIETPDGETVTGETILPGTTGGGSIPVVTVFNRDHDSLFVNWTEVPSTSRYALRIDTPFGPYTLFVDSLEYLISGGLRNTDAERFPRVFLPGFTQNVSVAAVDRNFYDYYRSFSDPFTGAGQLNTVRGGLGLFGASVRVRQLALRVVADIDDPVEGAWLRDPRGTAGGAPQRLELYVDTRAGAVEQITGNWRRGTETVAPGLLGTLENGRLTVALLAGQSLADTVDVFTARVDGPVIEGTFRAMPGTAIYIRN